MARSRRRGTASTGNASRVFGAAFEAARERVGEQASELVQQAKENSREFIQERKGLLANELGNVSGAIRRTADKLEDSDNALLAGYVDTAAKRLEDVSRYIESHDLGDLAEDIGELARRQPVLFVGGMFLAGLAAGRFVKSSSGASGSQRRRRR